MPLLGAHQSIAGGLQLAFTRIRAVGGQALQIFTRNQRQWRAAPVTADERALFAAAWREWGPWPVAAHDSYLINLASPDREVREKSVVALADELTRCAALAIPFVVMHPGSHGGDGIAAGLARMVEHLDRALELAADAGQVMVLLENTAGQGNALGADLAELAFIINHSAHSPRLGVCLDTCHLFAAGYDFRTPAAYRKTMAEFDRLIGLERLRFFHVNDSKKGLGSRVDRHEHIGCGAIGLDGFRQLLTDPRFSGHPMTLETPKGEDLKEDELNLRVLRNCAL
jgi:deoxyribonuclease-4